MLQNTLVGALALALAAPAFAAEAVPASTPEKAESECCAKMEARGKKCCCCDKMADAKAPSGDHGEQGHESHGQH